MSKQTINSMTLREQLSFGDSPIDCTIETSLRAAEELVVEVTGCSAGTGESEDGECC